MSESVPSPFGNPGNGAVESAGETPKGSTSRRETTGQGEAPLLVGANLGYSDVDTDSCIVIDREANRASIAPMDEARAFLQSQWPSQPPLTPEQQEEFNREIECLMKEWREQPVDHEAIAREMAEQRARMGRMPSWLDMCPVAPQTGLLP